MAARLSRPSCDAIICPASVEKKPNALESGRAVPGSGSVRLVEAPVGPYGKRVNSSRCAAEQGNPATRPLRLGRSGRSVHRVAE